MRELGWHFQSHSVILGVANNTEFLLAFYLILLGQEETSRTDGLDKAGVECFLEFFDGVSIGESTTGIQLNAAEAAVIRVPFGSGRSFLEEGEHSASLSAGLCAT